MPIIDDRTSNLNLPKPNLANLVPDDITRLRDTLDALDSIVAGLQATLAGKADAAALGTYLTTSMRNAANGVAGLTALGQIEESVLPQSILGGIKYKGTWNPASNTPAIPAAATGNEGHYYIASVDGSTLIDGVNDWKSGDWILSTGASWKKVDNTDRVVSVAGKTGAVTLVAGDVAGAAPLASPDFTGVPTAPTADPGTNTTQLATTAFVQQGIGAAGAAPLASPNFTGVPTAPMADPGTNTNQIATTAFVQQALGAPAAWKLITRLSLSAAPSQVVQNLGSYKALRLSLIGMKPSTDGKFFAVQISSDNGATWFASNYVNEIISSNVVTGTKGTSYFSPEHNNGGTQDVGNATNDGSLSGIIEIFNFNEAQRTHHQASYTWGDANGGFRYSKSVGWQTSMTAMNALNIWFSSSTNMTGTIVIEGLT